MQDYQFVITAAIGIGIGNYALFYLLLQKDFVIRYKKFTNKFDMWLIEENNRFYERINAKLGEKVKPDELIKYVNTWGKRFTIMNEIKQRRENVSNSIKYIYYLLFFSIIFALLHLSNPGRINPGAESAIYYISLSWACLFIMIIYVVGFILRVHSINEDLIKFDMGKSIQDIFKKEFETLE